MSVILDVVERLLNTAGHPDIVKVARYGPDLGPWGPTAEKSPVKNATGLKVTHQSTATAMLWEAIWPGEQPIEAPAVLPAPKQNRAPRLVLLVAQLLEVARPAEFKAWRLVTLPDLGRTDMEPRTALGLSFVLADGTRMLLRASATGATMGVEDEEDRFPDYVIPERATA
jgi:hypothetical protein